MEQKTLNISHNRHFKHACIFLSSISFLGKGGVENRVKKVRRILPKKKEFRQYFKSKNRTNRKLDKHNANEST